MRTKMTKKITKSSDVGHLTTTIGEEDTKLEHNKQNIKKGSCPGLALCPCFLPLEACLGGLAWGLCNLCSDDCDEC